MPRKKVNAAPAASSKRPKQVAQIQTTASASAPAPAVIPGSGSGTGMKTRARVAREAPQEPIPVEPEPTNEPRRSARIGDKRKAFEADLERPIKSMAKTRLARKDPAPKRLPKAVKSEGEKTDLPVARKVRAASKKENEGPPTKKMKLQPQGTTPARKRSPPTAVRRRREKVVARVEPPADQVQIEVAEPTFNSALYSPFGSPSSLPSLTPSPPPVFLQLDEDGDFRVVEPTSDAPILAGADAEANSTLPPLDPVVDNLAPTIAAQEQVIPTIVIHGPSPETSVNGDDFRSSSLPLPDDGMDVDTMQDFVNSLADFDFDLFGRHPDGAETQKDGIGTPSVMESVSQSNAGRAINEAEEPNCPLATLQFGISSSLTQEHLIEPLYAGFQESLLYEAPARMDLSDGASSSRSLDQLVPPIPSSSSNPHLAQIPERRTSRSKSGRYTGNLEAAFDGYEEVPLPQWVHQENMHPSNPASWALVPATYAQPGPSNLQFGDEVAQFVDTNMDLWEILNGTGPSSIGSPMDSLAPTGVLPFNLPQGHAPPPGLYPMPSFPASNFDLHPLVPQPLPVLTPPTSGELLGFPIDLPPSMLENVPGTQPYHGIDWSSQASQFVSPNTVPFPGPLLGGVLRTRSHSEAFEDEAEETRKRLRLENGVHVSFAWGYQDSESHGSTSRAGVERSVDQHMEVIGQGEPAGGEVGEDASAETESASLVHAYFHQNLSAIFGEGSHSNGVSLAMLEHSTQGMALPTPPSSPPATIPDAEHATEELDEYDQAEVLHIMDTDLGTWTPGQLNRIPRRRSGTWHTPQVGPLNQRGTPVEVWGELPLGGVLNLRRMLKRHGGAA